MVTQNDRTVPDAVGVIESVAHLGLAHIGFKDIGADRDRLLEIHSAIRTIGAQSYMELVDTDAANSRESVIFAAAAGVDHVLGGRDPAMIQDLLIDTPVNYYAFAGIPEGHPTRLRGGTSEISESCRSAVDLGCAGVDLLAYRAVDAAPLDLLRAARAACTSRLIVAGSITSAAQLDELNETGADAFTIGSALFAETFEPESNGLAAQIRAVLAACGPNQVSRLA